MRRGAPAAAGALARRASPPRCSPGAAAAPAAPSAPRRSRRRASSRSSGFQPAGLDHAGPPDDRLVHRAAAERQAAHQLQDRRGPAHGRAPDHRPRRPRLHHPRAPADRPGRAAQADRHVPGARPLPGARRRLPEHPRRAAELPAVPHGRRERPLPPGAAARVQARPGRRRLPHRRCRATRRCTRSRPRSSTSTCSTPRATRSTSSPGSARSRTRSSSTRDRSTTSTPTCAGRTLPTARASLGATRVTGRATAPGKLTLGVLLPVPGTWRLFLQMKLGGHVITAPYTLKVGS